MFFSDVIGQEELKKSLVEAVDGGHMAHATIFLEEPGRGGLALAIALASYISCENKTAGDSCGHCKSCVKHAKLVHPDLHFVFPVNSNKSVSSDKKPVSDMFIDTWRELVLDDPYFTEQDFYSAIGIDNKSGLINVSEAQEILRKLSFKPMESEFKIMIIWLPEKMNGEAANKLLKLIEEPPAKTLFFMVCNSIDKMLPTILSRCRIVKVPPIAKGDLARRIEKQYGLSAEDAAAWAGISSGSMTVFKERWNEEHEQHGFKETVEELLDSSISGNLSRVIDIATGLSETGREQQKAFCRYLSGYLRRICLCGFGMPDLSGCLPSEMDAVRGYSAAFDRDSYEKIYALINESVSCIDSNVSGKLVFMDLCCRIYAMVRRSGK